MSGVTGTISQLGITGSMTQLGVTGSITQLGIVGSISEGGAPPAWTPETPLGLLAVMESDTVINLSVTNTSSGEDGLSWEVSTDNITFTQHGTSAIGVYRATGLTPGTKYFWKVRQYKGALYSDYSNLEQETTLDSVVNSGDGKTWGHFDGKDLTTITKNGSDQMSAWNCKQASGHNLLQAGADGIKPVHKYGHYVSTDGIGQFMKTAADVLIQPTTIYIVCRQKNWTSAGSFFDGNAANSGRIFQHVTIKNYKAYAGTESALVTYSMLNTWDVIRVVFNGASSKIQVNETPAYTGNYGAGNMGGFTFGCRGDNNYFGALEVKEIIIRAEADDTNYASIYSYLRARHFNRVFEEGMVAFTFDNGNLSQYQRSFPLFVNRGVKSTHYLNSDLMGINDPIGVMNMSWANAKEMYDAGFDMECHGQTHIGFMTLVNTDPQDLIDELTVQNTTFIANGMAAPAHTGYPNGEAVTALVVKTMLPLRESGRDYISPIDYTYLETNKIIIPEQHIDKNYSGPPANDEVAAAKTKIDYCVANKTAMFFTAHDVRAVGDDTGGPASIKLDILTEILDYAIASGVAIKTHKEIADLMDV